MLSFLIFIGKLIGFVSAFLNLGSGGTWPGEIALLLDKNILQKFIKQLRCGVIIVAGTNGKTTTSLMVKKILEHEGKTIIHNASGANLLNGIVSAFIQKASCSGVVKADWGIFEIDENTLPLVLPSLQGVSDEAVFKNNESIIGIAEPSERSRNDEEKGQKIIIVLLNLFRDQLDRYGEVDVIAEKWKKSLAGLSKETTVILNADDPQICHLGKNLKAKVLYFGLNDAKHFLPKMEHATDSTFCLNCGGRLKYKGIYFSHLGIWHCEKCGEKRPRPDLSFWKSIIPGLYNQYNTLAAVLTAKSIAIGDETIEKSLANFSPAFGRQEEFEVGNKKIKIFLSKNPAGFNASLRTIMEFHPKAMLFILNDRIPDGRDVSWIWDTDIETIPQGVNITVSGDRVYDMALRVKYADKKNLFVEKNLLKGLNKSLSEINTGETLYVMPTYSGMLEVRKILVGRKIL